MTTKIKLSLLVGVSFALAATPALAQTVPSATPDGGLFADFGFVADVTPPTIANENDETAVDAALKGKNTDSVELLRDVGGRSGKTLTIDLSK